MLQFQNKREVTICAGTGQTGKSTFAIRYLLNAPLAVRYVFDDEGEYSQRLGIAPAGNAYDLNKALLTGWVLFDPDVLFPGRHADAFKFFCDWAFQTASCIPGKKVLVADEIWRHCTPQSIPDELANVCQTGRKRGLGLMVNTQLPTALNRSLLSLCSEMIFFRLNFDAALDLAARRGFDPDQVKTLPDLHFISRTDQGGELRGVIEI